MRHKRYLIFLFIIVALIFTTIAGAGEWQELKSEHFLLYFTENEEFAKDVLYKAEQYYKDIALDLGYPRYSKFWIWENRVKIYIYPDHASYLEATGLADWSHGAANYADKTIASYIWGKEFTASILPHEIAHLIFRDFVGFEGEIPLWLDEGVAQWAEEAKRIHFKAMTKKSYDDNLLLALDEMMKLDIRKLKDGRVYIRPTMSKDGKASVLFLDREGMIDAYYLQSVSIIGFLIEKYGSDRFAHFCRQLRDGKTLNEALKFAYPMFIRNISELEREWKKYIIEED